MEPINLDKLSLYNKRKAISSLISSSPPPKSFSSISDMMSTVESTDLEKLFPHNECKASEGISPPPSSRSSLSSQTSDASTVMGRKEIQELFLDIKSKFLLPSSLSRCDMTSQISDVTTIMEPMDIKELSLDTKSKTRLLSPLPRLNLASSTSKISQTEPSIIEELALETKPKIKSSSLIPRINLTSTIREVTSKTETTNIEKVPLNNKRKAPSPSPSPSLEPPSSPIRLPIKENRHGNHTYRAGKCAELSDGSFLRITSLSRDSHGNIWLTGDHLARATLEGLMLPRRRNELVWLSTIKDTGTGTASVPVPVERNITDAIRIRRVNFTNQTYESLNTHTHANALRNARDDVEIGELFCRLRRIRIVSKNHTVIEDILCNLSATESDQRHRKDERELREEWRGVRIRAGGSYTADQQVFGLDGGCETVRVRKYSLGDAFCGGGGITRGAFMADLQSVFGFDFDEKAMMTYRANFEGKGTKCRRESVDEFLHRVSLLSDEERQAYTVDILHISPPCQPFSPAHTVPNEEKDARNEAVMFSVLQLLQTLRPRVVTVEETFGLLRHVEFLSALIHIFAMVGYSVRWKVCNFAQWGVPQTRRRLLFIAAAPGEKLPPFPKATHGEGLKRMTTIQETLDKIPDNATRQEVLPGGEWPKTPFSADTLSKTFTCNGGQNNYHPSGTRAYTIREIASLQTFPWYHLFPGKSVTTARRQIGNAVPPLVAKVLYQEIVRVLRETDRVDLGEQDGDGDVQMVLD